MELFYWHDRLYISWRREAALLFHKHQVQLGHLSIEWG